MLVMHLCFAVVLLKDHDPNVFIIININWLIFSELLKYYIYIFLFKFYLSQGKHSFTIYIFLALF